MESSRDLPISADDQFRAAAHAKFVEGNNCIKAAEKLACYKKALKSLSKVQTGMPDDGRNLSHYAYLAGVACTKLNERYRFFSSSGKYLGMLPIHLAIKDWQSAAERAYNDGKAHKSLLERFPFYEFAFSCFHQIPEEQRIDDVRESIIRLDTFFRDMKEHFFHDMIYPPVITQWAAREEDKKEVEEKDESAELGEVRPRKKSFSSGIAAFTRLFKTKVKKNDDINADDSELLIEKKRDSTSELR